jgi:hypothetical protein
MLTQFLNFDKMITPVLIKIIFWIGILQAFGLGLFVMIAGFGAAAAGDHSGLSGLFIPLGLIGGLLVFAFSIFLTRIFCELMILSFQIHGALIQIRDRTAPLPSPSAPAGYYPATAAPTLP